MTVISTKSTSVIRVFGFNKVQEFISNLSFTDENQTEIEVKVVDNHKHGTVYEITYTAQTTSEIFFRGEGREL